MAQIELHGIEKRYRIGEQDIPVLHGVSLAVDSGEYVALMGASGSGKSTLMNILGCLDRPSAGRYYLENEEVGSVGNDRRAMIRNRKIGFVFQSFNLLPRTSALDNVTMPLAYSHHGWNRRRHRELGMAMLEKVNLGGRWKHYPSQLSGGQQQRVAIARALIGKPPILFADEPTGNLDSHTSNEIMDLFAALNRDDGITIILVTHAAEVAQYADRAIHIKDGNIVSGAFGKAETGGGQ